MADLNGVRAALQLLLADLSPTDRDFVIGTAFEDVVVLVYGHDAADLKRTLRGMYDDAHALANNADGSSGLGAIAARQISELAARNRNRIISLTRLLNVPI